ncbi:putative ABC transport system permease protein [Cytobacillus eiseniae]|uniref:ABC transport system permease protein n=1 Tax=Cytobacillus eiseniae TaxID=762947 RepID=A0ABS4RCK6_9BACI|nr:ABC transporter permease [Cytobacillus eiseniae]MBP2239582.1 putative ABC transport system permease protein [Cytobacillus eiseniae]
MNIINKLTVRHLKQNKKRTLVTIIGVIISVAMVTAVATLGISFMDLMKRQTIASDGEWHVQYKDVNNEQLEAITTDEETEKVVLSRDLGYANLEGSQNENKPYVFVKEYDAEGFNQFPIELSQGRLPKEPNEVVLSEEIALNGKVEFEVGDSLKLEVGDRKGLGGYLLTQIDSLQKENGELIESLDGKELKNYTIVGFIKRPTWEPTWSPGYTILTYLDEKTITEDDPVRATVVLKKVKRSLYEHAETLANKENIDLTSISYNNGLLRYYGVTNNDGLKSTLFSLSAIIISIIIIGSVSLIYNAFAISVSERARHLGMLSSVGATKRQKRNSVFFEGMIIGLISIPIGILSGLAGIGITFLFINSIIQGALGVTEKLTVTVTLGSILIACGVSILTIFISTFVPAMKASKISAIDAIRQTSDVKLSGKQVKTSKFVRMLFGIEAEIGLKNLKRNKRRYRATIFSLVISIVLFLSVSYFTTSLKKSLVLSQSGVDYDIQVSVNQERDDLIKTITSLENVTEFNVVKELNATSFIKEVAIADELKEMLVAGESSLAYYISIHALNEDSLKSYAKRVGTDYEQLKNPEKISSIVIDTIKYEDMNAGKYVETKAIHTKIGEKLNVVYEDWETSEKTELDQIEIVATTDQYPMGVHSGGVGGLDIIVSEQVMNKLTEKIPNPEIASYIYLKSSDPMKTQQEMEEMKDHSFSFYNVYQGRQQEEQMLMLMSVFTYGFIVLITAISIANIFNTISTSIALRKREFAMLKSVGMTPNGFNKMINYESIFYGINSLLFGLPLSIIVMYLIYKGTMNSFSYAFTLPWTSMLYCLIAVFVIVLSAMLYSSGKVKKENIIDGLKQENI